MRFVSSEVVKIRKFFAFPILFQTKKDISRAESMRCLLISLSYPILSSGFFMNSTHSLTEQPRVR